MHTCSQKFKDSQAYILHDSHDSIPQASQHKTENDSKIMDFS